MALNARRHPEKTALIYEDKVYSYAEFNQTVNQLAHGLLHLGIKKGEKLALMLKNTYFFPICYYAAAKIGAVLVPMNFRLVSREINYILEIGRAHV
jgi:acyl-CoA synthetase (AMP-forming)/AMP-acid ligase II